MSTKSDTQATSTDSNDAPASSHGGGFFFGSSSGENPDHTVSVSYVEHYIDRIQLRDGRVVESSGNGGHFGPDDHIECSCGEEFRDRDKAKEHLSVVQQRYIHSPPAPEMHETTIDRSEVLFGGHVEGQVVRGNHLAVVEDGHDYLAATARETYRPPEHYAFETWEPLSSGRLRHQGGDKSKQLFRVKSLQQAMQRVTGNRTTYDPDRYTIYFRGHEPLYIEGAGRGVAVAPVKISR